jgi:hypothetical protein
LVTGGIEDAIGGTEGTGKVNEVTGCEIVGSPWIEGTGKVGVVTGWEILVGTVGIGGTGKVLVDSAVLEGGTSVTSGVEVVFEISGTGVAEDMIGRMGGTGKVGGTVTGCEMLGSPGIEGTGKVGVAMGCGVDSGV